MTGSSNLLLLGTVASSAEELTTRNGKLWVKLLIEVKSWRRASDGEAASEEVTLLPVNLFSRIAETALQFLKVGDAVAITARVSGTEYTGADGKTRRGINLTAELLHLIPAGRKSGSSASPIKAAAPKPAGARKDRDWERKPVMRDVPLNDQGEPADINF